MHWTQNCKHVANILQLGKKKLNVWDNIFCVIIIIIKNNNNDQKDND